MTGAHVDQAAGIHPGIHHLLADLLRADDSGFMGVSGLNQILLLNLEHSELPWRIGQFTEAPAQVAVDPVFTDSIAHQRHGFDPGAFHVIHAFSADITSEPANVMANTANQLPAITPASPPTDTPGLQQDHRESALGKFDGGVHSGKPAADHADIGIQVRSQRGVGRQAFCTGGVIGVGMFVAVLIHLLDFTLLQERVIRRMMPGAGWWKCRVCRALPGKGRPLGCSPTPRPCTAWRPGSGWRSPPRR